MKKVYIAGPMTGYDDWNFPAFFDAENQLKELGYETLNPAANDGASLETAIQNAISARDAGATWSGYMRRDLSNLLLSDYVCVLPNWQRSKGASLEVHVAKALGIPLMILRDGQLIPRVTCVGISGYARSGKDTVAAHLIESAGFTRMSFADPMREALVNLNPNITFVGLEDSVELKLAVERFGWEALKSLAPEVRGLMQRMGTEVGREMFNEDFWVDAALDRAEDGSKLVFSDVRYPNEANAIKKLGGKVYRVTRKGVGPANSHPSEIGMDDYEVDVLIENNGSLSDLAEKIEGIFVNG